MIRWDEFAAACPELAALGEERLRQHELCLVGTLRQDGSPRISPVEPEFAAGHLFLGMMWQSKKALDLLRDPRCVVHNCVTNRHGTEGDFKLYGRAVPVDDPDLRRAAEEATFARIGWAPTDTPYHLFSLDIASAGFTQFGDDGYVLVWDPQRGLRRLPLPAG